MILYVLRYYPTLTETFVYREIAELRRRGVPVALAALGHRADGDLADELPDVPVLRPPRGRASWRLARPLVASTRATRDALAWLGRYQRPRDVLRAAWLTDQARALGVTRVHAHFAGEAAEVARVVGAGLGVPWSVTVHAVDLFKPRPSLGELLREASPVVTIADHHQRWLAERWQVPSEVVRMGVDTARFRPAAGVPVTDGPLRVICVARYAPKKGIVGLVEVVEALPEPVELRLVSDAPGSLASARVRVGSLPPSAIPGALGAADLFALPCRIADDGDRDGIPVALLEAMAAGLPVVTTAVSGIGELVDDSVGWLVPPDDPSALAEAIRHAATDPEARHRRGEAARARILERRLTVAAQVDALLTAWGRT